MVEALIALAAAIFGGAGLKAIESFLSRGTQKMEFATQIREELRDDIVSLRAQLAQKSDELEDCTQRVYTLNHKYEKLRIRFLHADSIIQDIVDKCEVGELEGQTIERARKYIAEVFEED